MIEQNYPDRRSIRLRDYDYTTPGAYFITICAQGGASLFGEIIDGEMRQNPAGEMVAEWWHRISDKFVTVTTDAAFVVMPNHIHGVIVISDAIVGSDPCVCPAHDPSAKQQIREQPNAVCSGGHVGPPLRCGGVGKSGGHTGPPLHNIVLWFKTMTTNVYIHGVKELGWVRFDGRLWQRNYYEHVIRNERELERVRQYIDLNPLRWEFDRENPHRSA